MAIMVPNTAETPTATKAMVEAVLQGQKKAGIAEQTTIPLQAEPLPVGAKPRRIKAIDRQHNDGNVHKPIHHSCKHTLPGHPRS